MNETDATVESRHEPSSPEPAFNLKSKCRARSNCRLVHLSLPCRSSNELQFDWTQDEQKFLLDQVLKMVGDKLSFSSARSKVQWEKINMKGRSAEDCEKMFNTLTGKIRKFRLLSEIIGEAASEIEKGFSVKFLQENFQDFPKKPPQTMTLYLKDHQAEFEGIASGKDFFRALTQKWRDCPEEEKEFYKNKYKKKVKKYKKKLEEFKKKHPSLIIRDLSSTSIRVPPPVLPNPLLLYIKHVQPKVQGKHPEFNSSQLRSKCSSKYHKLSDSKKLKWILRAKEQLKEYEEQCELYHQEKPDAELKPPVLNLSKDDQKILDKHEGKPFAPAINIFRFFCARIKMDSEPSIAERSKKLSQLYHDLSEEELLKLKEDYKEAVHTYIKDFISYYESLPADKQETEQASLTALAQYKKVLDGSQMKKRKKSQADEEGLVKKAKKEKDKKTPNGSESSSTVEVQNSPPKTRSKSVGKQDCSENEMYPTPSTSEASISAMSPKKKEKLSSEIYDALLTFSSPVATSTHKQKTMNDGTANEAGKKKNSPLKGSASLKTDEIKDSLLAFSSPVSVKRKLHDEKAVNQQVIVNESEKRGAQSKASDNGPFAAFFSPIKTSIPQEESTNKQSKVKKSKKKV